MFAKDYFVMKLFLTHTHTHLKPLVVRLAGRKEA